MVLSRGLHGQPKNVLKSRHRSEYIKLLTGTNWHCLDNILLQLCSVSLKKNNSGHLWAWKVTTQNSRGGCWSAWQLEQKIACFCQTPQGKTFGNIFCLELIAWFRRQFTRSTTWRQSASLSMFSSLINHFMTKEPQRERVIVWRWREYSMIFLYP